jgi:hypothetical protein
VAEVGGQNGVAIEQRGVDDVAKPHVSCNTAVRACVDQDRIAVLRLDCCEKSGLVNGSRFLAIGQFLRSQSYSATPV